MQIETSRFGTLDIEADAIVLLPDGIIGFPQERHWVLLREGESPTLGWLQSITDPELALSVVTPQAFVPNYVLRFRREEISSLPWTSRDEVVALAVVSLNDEQLTINLKAPILINLKRCVGCQLLTCDDQPLQCALPNQHVPMRKSA
jgi:flagellar assembly factor FliW